MKKHNIFLAPHLDDAALSCGDLICKLVTRDEKCTVITIFSGSPATKFLSAAAKQFHSNCNFGNNPIFHRKMEDKNAMRLLGCEYKHLDFLECLYRADEPENHIYSNLNQIYCYNHDKDKNYEYMVEKALYSEVKDSDVVYAPLSIGNHADHIMTKILYLDYQRKYRGKFIITKIYFMFLE
ncbi:MAG: PIG-L family deacetylase [Endomicrobium sp.]|jgi:LmbE family N-acetylglucosaminyl deacetylase|nr:PIG-L family deacetylase [Endomicrobium sp.]